jgi:hypothetical protein
VYLIKVEAALESESQRVKNYLIYPETEDKLLKVYMSAMCLWLCVCVCVCVRVCAVLLGSVRSGG